MMYKHLHVTTTGRSKGSRWAGLFLAFLLVGTVGCAESNGYSNASGSSKANIESSGDSSASVQIKGRWATVTHVADGDTVELDGHEKVRLIGVNTPETVKPDTPVQPYGKEASNFTKSQLQGKRVFVETDVQPKDRYGRTLAYLFLQQPKTEQEVSEEMYNAILLREGYAQLMTIPPNVKYSDLFVQVERQAHAENKGLWKLGIYKDNAKSTNDVFLPGKAPK